MMRLHHWVHKLIADQEGLTTVEYALLLSGLLIGAGVLWSPLRCAVLGIVGDTGDALGTAADRGCGCP